MIMRALGVGLRKPKDTRLGVDFAGTVEAVGKNVTQFKPGDEVFGGRRAPLPSMLCPRADRAVALKPANITFEQAASINIAGITALQAVARQRKSSAGAEGLDQRRVGRRGHVRGANRKIIRRRSDRRVQHAKCRLVRSLGADHVIDYTKEDFTKGDATLRRDSRQRCEPFVVRMQARLNSQREIRHDRRRRSERQADGSDLSVVRFRRWCCHRS